MNQKLFNNWEHLLLELEDIGKSEKQSFSSNLTILIADLPKLIVQSDAPEMMKGSWYSSITEDRSKDSIVLICCLSLAYLHRQ